MVFKRECLVPIFGKVIILLGKWDFHPMGFKISKGLIGTQVEIHIKFAEPRLFSSVRCKELVFIGD